MEDRFDALAKAVAGGLSRREALRRLGGGLAAVLLSAVGLAPAALGAPRGGGGNTCNNYCTSRFAPGPAQVQCKRACDACGGDTSRLCTGGPTQGVACCGAGQRCCMTQLGVPFCATLASNVNNCGACGNACAEDCCSGTCTNTLSDLNNCGTCGNRCTQGADPRCCSGVCTDLQSSPSNCGQCGGGGFVCPTGVCRFATCTCGASPGDCPPGQRCLSDGRCGFG